MDQKAVKYLKGISEVSDLKRKPADGITKLQEGRSTQYSTLSDDAEGCQTLTLMYQSHLWATPPGWRSRGQKSLAPPLIAKPMNTFIGESISERFGEQRDKCG
jgi:hypothetical protein